MPRRGKRDGNEPSLVKYLRKMGASVTPLSIKGAPDLLVGYQGKNYLFEVKNGKAKLTEDEVVWHGKWTGQVSIIRTEEDIKSMLFDVWEYLKGSFDRDTCIVTVSGEQLCGEYTLNQLGSLGWEAFSLFGWATNDPQILFKRRVAAHREEAQELLDKTMQKLRTGCASVPGF